MAPPKKSKGKIPKKDGDDADVSHVSQTDDENPKEKEQTKKSDSNEPFHEDDYQNPTRAAKEVFHLGLQGKKCDIVEKKKKLTKKRKREETNTEAEENLKMFKQMQAQINQIQNTLNNFSQFQNKSTGKAAEQRDLAGTAQAGQTSSESSESGESSSESEDSDSSQDSPLKAHLSNVAGGSNDSFDPSSISLHAFVDKRMKKKIWALKYIDLTKLLDKDERPKPNKFMFEIADSKLQKVKANEVNFQSFQLWDKAFSISISTCK